MITAAYRWHWFTPLLKAWMRCLYQVKGLVFTGREIYDLFKTVVCDNIEEGLVEPTRILGACYGQVSPVDI